MFVAQEVNSDKAKYMVIILRCVIPVVC